MMEYTLFGYDGNENIIIYVKAIDHIDAMDRCRGYFDSGTPDFMVEGRHKDLSGNGYKVIEL